MTVVVLFAAVVLLGLILHRGPSDSRESEHSKEHVLAGYGMTWPNGARSDEALGQDWGEALERARVARARSSTSRPRQTGLTQPQPRAA
jgi:hypothetical protein